MMLSGLGNVIPILGMGLLDMDIGTGYGFEGMVSYRRGYAKDSLGKPLNV